MANRKVLAEMISQFVDQMLLGRCDAATYVAAFAGCRSQLEPLLCLATRLRAELTPVEPRPAFREDLRRRLLIAASSRAPARHHSLLGLSAPRREVVLGAAAVGSLMSAAAIVMIARSRSHSVRRAA